MSTPFADPGDEQAPLKVLVVDDEAAIRRNLRSYLEDLGWSVVEAGDGDEALQVFAREQPAIVLTDLRMPKRSGLELLAALQKTNPDVPVIVVSGTGTVHDAVTAMRQGAWDYLIKPLQEAGELEMVVRRVWERKQLVAENRRYQDSLEQLVRERTRELRKLSLAVEQSPVAILITDAKGRIEYVNRAFVRDTGYRPEEVLGQNPRLLKSGQHMRAEDYRELWATITGGGEWNGEFLNQRKDGTLFWEQAIISPLKDEAGVITHFLSQMEDITEQKRAEAERANLQGQLIQAQKMEAVGQLAGGVAHDFNNILAAIMMNLDLLQENAGLGPETQDALQELMTEARRAASLTRQLLMFSRRSVLDARVLDLDELVTNLMKMLRRLIGEHIELEFQSQSLTPLVEADEGMLEQVLMNLAVNARDAMPKGGRIDIATEAVEVDEARARLNPNARTGRFVCLSVTDNGCGMDPATLRRIFEPFFTTKEAGKGTGLGLATVHGIVKQHNGWVEVESTVGHGTAFRVWLPLATRSQESLSHGEAPPPATGGSETILLVEDDANVRRVIAIFLRRKGYAVIEADRGTEALRQWARHRDQISLLVTDMVMPEGMTGLELMERLRAERPGLKAVICSGYSAEMIGTGWQTGKDVTYLPKPCEATRLAATVREVLDRRA